MGKTGSLLLALLLLGGCMAFDPGRRQPTWVPVQAALHPRIGERPVNEIVVLPFTPGNALVEQLAALQDAVTLSLRESGWFRVQQVTLRGMGRAEAEIEFPGDKIPIETLIRYRKEYDADAVLFGSISYTRFAGDPAFGLKLILMDTRDGRVLWVADDVLDSMSPHVRLAFLSYCRNEIAHHEEDPPPPAEVPLREFARFVGKSFVRSFMAQASKPPTGFWDRPREQSQKKAESRSRGTEAVRITG
jgi:hypothetical protein